MKPNHRAIVAFLSTGMLLATIGACQSDDGPGGKTRMFVSSKEFNRGRDDGRRDAKLSWTDDSAAWTWMWMMEAQYKRGYEQGWREGRAEVKFESQQEDAKQWQKDQQSEQGIDESAE